MVEQPGRDHDGLQFRYGSAGDKIYDPRRRAWIATRSSTPTRSLEWLGLAESVIAPPLQHDEDASLPTGNTKLRAVDEIISRHPTLHAASKLLAQAVRYADIRPRGSHEDASPHNGLLSLGYASGLNRRTAAADSRKANIFPIIAIPGGDHGEVLCIREMRPCRQGWYDDHGSWLTTFEIDSTETIWCGGHERIQQLCFADPVEDCSTLLGLLYPNSITVFSPRASDTILSHTSARINPYPICTLKLDSADGTCYTCMAFNPWYQYQIATIDGKGRWGIWMIEKSTKHSTSSHEATVHVQGVVDVALLDNSDDSGARNVPWLKVFWIGNLSTIALCSHRVIQILSFGSKGIRSKSFNFYPPTPQTSVVDVEKRPSKTDEIFVLTTSQVLWCRLQSPESFGQGDEVLSSLSVISCWDHHINADDNSLRLTLRDGDEGVAVLLYSRQQPCVIEFFFQSPREYTSDLAISTKDPISLVLPSIPTRITRRVFLPELYFYPLSVFAGEQGVGNSTLKAYERRGATFFQLFMLGKDSSLVSQLCCEHDAILPSGALVKAPEWKTTRKSYISRAGARVHDNFVVKDEEDSGVDEQQYLQPARRERDGSSLANQRMVANHAMYLAAIDNTMCQTCDLAPFVDELVHRLTIEAQDPMVVLNPLTFYLEGEVTCRNMDLAASSLYSLLHQKLADLPRDSSHIQFSRLVSLDDPAFGSVLDSPMTLPSVYRSLIDAWLGSLPTWVPGRTRLDKEKLARHIAASLCLASTSVQSRLPKDLMSAASNTQSISRPSQDYYQSSSFSDMSTKPTRQTDTASLVDSAIARLRRYTSIKDPPTKFNESTSKILSHWTPGADPSKYDHAAATASQTGIEAIAGSAMTAEQRDKNRRRLERILLREQRAAKRPRRDPLGAYGESQVSVFDDRGVVSSQQQYRAPEVSSQAPAAVSSLQAVDGIMASQVEPGRFGGRPDNRGAFPIRAKPKPARKAGF